VPESIKINSNLAVRQCIGAGADPLQE